MSLASPTPSVETTVHVRAMREADVPAAAEVLLGEPWVPHYQMTRERAQALLRQGLRDGAHLLVAEADGAVRGFVWYVPRGAFAHSGYIRLIGVLPGEKRRGVGRVLLEAAEYAMADSRDVMLLVSDFNTGAQAFYRHLGYEQVGALPDYVMPGIAEIIMRKRLR